MDAELKMNMIKMYYSYKNFVNLFDKWTSIVFLPMGIILNLFSICVFLPKRFRKNEIGSLKIADNLTYIGTCIWLAFAYMVAINRNQFELTI